MRSILFAFIVAGVALVSANQPIHKFDKLENLQQCKVNADCTPAEGLTAYCHKQRCVTFPVQGKHHRTPKTAPVATEPTTTPTTPKTPKVTSEAPKKVQKLERAKKTATPNAGTATAPIENRIRRSEKIGAVCTTDDQCGFKGLSCVEGTCKSHRPVKPSKNE